MNPRELVGRAREYKAFAELVAPGETGPVVMTLVGERGSGRTSLIELAAALGADAGRRVLTVSGQRGEADVPLSGLSHLLLPFVNDIELLPLAHGAALGRALGLASETTPFDLVATGMAVLALMTVWHDSPAVLVTVDDADYVDAETMSVLAFVASRMDRRSAVLVLSSEPSGVPAAFQRDTERHWIGPLCARDANTLLERQGPPLDSSIRKRIVEQSAGSPLALLETAAATRASADLPRSTREPLRVGPIIEERVMERVRTLPAPTQEWLLDAAVAETYAGVGGATMHPIEGNLDVVGQAERSGFVRIDQSGVSFVHPVLWIAIYYAAPFVAGLQAHHRVASRSVDHPSRQAWHLGRAAIHPDERVALQLETSAHDVARQFGRREMALVLERAGELSTDNDERAQRFLAAATTAASTGDREWADVLIARAMTSARDPGIRMKSMVTSAWASAARGNFSAAMAELFGVVAETVDSAPDAAAEVLSIAAAVGYQSGSRAIQSQMRAAAGRLGTEQNSNSTFTAARFLWIESYLRPSTNTEDRIDRLRRLSATGPTDEATLSRLAGAAWFADESESAFDLADAAYHRLVQQGSYASAALLGPIRSWTAWETGRWQDALEFAEDATRVAEAAGEGMLRATDDGVASLVHAARGELELSETRVRAALALIQGEECLSIVARTQQARGLAAMASGDYSTAYAHLSRLFREDGAPLHWHISYFGLGDLAAAALRGDQLEVSRELLRNIIAQLPPDPAVRIRHLILRARALLAEDNDTAERFFQAAQRDAAGSRWPFERGQLLLDYGSWLRRKRRVGQAKVFLARAHSIFDELGAIPWKSQVEAELRASHVDVAGPAGSLEELTSQQREIVLLAGQGLTNREIATRMYLSPRTVASHLYRSFPKLGIRDRWQLRDLIDEPDETQIGPVLPL